MKVKSNMLHLAAGVLRTLLLLLLMPVGAFAASEADREIGVPQAKEASAKGCFGAVLSPDSNHFYTVREGLLTQYQISPFKKIGSIAIIDWEHVAKAEFITVPAAKIGVGVGRGCRVLMTNDKLKLIIIGRYRMFLLDARTGKILNKFERRVWGRGMDAATLNDNELLILDFDSSEQGGISLGIWDANTLKLKREFSDLGKSFGLVQDRELLECMSKILDRIYLVTAKRIVVLNGKTYTPELTLTIDSGLSSFNVPRISKNFQKLYVGNVSKVTDHLNGKHTSYENVKSDSVLVFDQETRQISIESTESVESIAREEFHPILASRGQLSRNKDYVMLSDTSYMSLRNLNTGMRFRLHQYESGEAILMEMPPGSDKPRYFQYTPHARKHLMMKNRGGQVVPINDATFNKYYRADGRH